MSEYIEDFMDELPMLGYFGTEETYAEEIEDTERLGERLVAEKKEEALRVREEISTETIYHGMRQAQKYGYNNYNDYVADACARLDELLESNR